MPSTSKEKAAPPERTRRHHTRSRAGCATCRKRHVRCDETRPVCLKCESGSRPCEYEPAPIPLRERRAKEKADIPTGAQQVWALDSTAQGDGMATPLQLSSSHPPASPLKLFPSAGIDPFDTLAIKMPFKSVQLMRYFYDIADVFGVAPVDPMDDCMAVVTHDSGALRSTLILAGLHYSWNVGGLSNFESTVLFHKVECIRTINELISNSTDKAFTNCIRQVATLTMAECCAGNFAMSDAHLRGLVAVVDARASQRKRISADGELDDELADRYLVLVYNFVYGFKSRLSDAADFDRLSKELQRKLAGGGTPDSTNSRDSSPEQQGKLGSEHIDFRLGAIRLIPYFFAPPPPGTLPKEVDVPSFVSALRGMTKMAERAQRAANLEEKVRIFHAMWTEGAATRLFLVFVDSHRHSFFAGRAVPQMTSRELASAWSGIATASGLYLNSVLDIWSIGQPIEARMLRHFLLMLERDIKLSRQVIEMRGSPAGDLWVWKTFVAAVSVARAEEASELCRKQLAEVGPLFSKYLKLWSEVSGTTAWSDVRAALERIVWPQDPIDEDLEQAVWEAALSEG